MDRYFTATRTHSYSLLFALPLLLLYETGAAFITDPNGDGFRNAADVILRTVLMLSGVTGTAGVTLVLIAIGAVLIILERRKRSIPMKISRFAGMAMESILYATMLGTVVGSATQFVVREFETDLAIRGSFSAMSVPEGLVLSIGAGLYEELLFRVVLAGGLFAIFRWSGLPEWRSGTFAVLLSALVFSGFHYIGSYGDPFEITSFLFRFFAGIVFSAIFLLRGFGITAWTHALYDVFVVFALSAR
ncbi:MAG: CPBP family intramembrane metalloprotease [Gemmatimonadota bacterium]|jgi:hypothetical protein|nr:CPBP family intramembrane metalloprotease [Gemmatimonadota bacterium]